jgi:hypothetical protein
MWRPRDRERYIGGYDPEHEMPDPDRDRGGRWQSDAYRHNSADTRFAYRWNPDRLERQSGPRDRGFEPRDWDRDARDREYARGYDHGYDDGFRSRAPYDRASHDRGWDTDRGYNSQRGGHGSDDDRDRYREEGWDQSRYDRDRWRR